MSGCQRFYRLLTGTLRQSRHCTQRKVSSQSQEIPRSSVNFSVGSLAEDFKLIKPDELAKIVAVYNHILPSIYPHSHMLEDHYTGFDDLYDCTGYNTRQNALNLLMRIVYKYHQNNTDPLHNAEEPSAVIEKEAESGPDEESEDYEHHPASPQYMLKLRKASIIFHRSHETIFAMRFGMPLVLDCGFERTMAGRETSSYIRQVFDTVLINRNLPQPFDLQICNLSPNSVLRQKYQSGERTLHDQLVTTHSGCFTDLHDKKDLVILSPDAPLYMEKFECDKVYVIGGIVDLGNCQPLTYEKALKLGVESRRLPIDIWTEWGEGGSKRMVISIVISMLATLRDTGDWSQAMTHVPQRFRLRKERRVVKKEVTQFQHRDSRRQAEYINKYTRSISV